MWGAICSNKRAIALHLRQTPPPYNTYRRQHYFLPVFRNHRQGVLIAPCLWFSRLQLWAYSVDGVVLTITDPFSPLQFRAYFSGLAPTDESESRIFGMKKGLEFISDPANQITEETIHRLYEGERDHQRHGGRSTVFGLLHRKCVS